MKNLILNGSILFSKEMERHLVATNNGVKKTTEINQFY